MESYHQPELSNEKKLYNSGTVELPKKEPINLSAELETEVRVRKLRVLEYTG